MSWIVLFDGWCGLKIQGSTYIIHLGFLKFQLQVKDHASRIWLPCDIRKHMTIIKYQSLLQNMSFFQTWCLIMHPNSYGLLTKTCVSVSCFEMQTCMPVIAPKFRHKDMAINMFICKMNISNTDTFKFGKSKPAISISCLACVCT